MNWNCNKGGPGANCFNKKRRPKIEVFAGCFPGRINFGDVDGLVEVSGFFCMLEWKGEGGSIKTGQRISFEKFTTTTGNIVFVVDGNAETMEIEGYSVFWHGRQRDWKASTLDELKDAIRWWVRWTRQPRKAA